MRRVGDANGAGNPAPGGSGHAAPGGSGHAAPGHPNSSDGRHGPAPRLHTLLRSLAPPVWRSLPWAALTATAGSGLLLAASTRLPDQAPGPAWGLVVLRLTALTGGVGLAFLLDDPARHTTAASPLGRPLRAGLRLAMAVPLMVLWWAAVLLVLPGPTRPPLGPVTLEALATAACAIALATAAVRFTHAAEVGKGTVARLGALAAVAVLVPARWGLLTLPGHRWWEETHVRWAVLLALTLVSTALCTPEPLRRTRVRPGPPDGAPVGAPAGRG
ncbi:ABC transporter [Streptomyces sp. NPDC017202]|uniref:ABC transporter n=1 Tax=Streptomyces sp. NPDC017202 TaxID=3364981 RepID=UPI0037876406